MYLELQKRFGAHLRAVLKDKYDLELATIPLEIPPDLKFGELSTPVAFELARKLRKAPKVIAQEIVAALGQPEGFSSFEVAGAGYINARLDRAEAVGELFAPKAVSISPLFWNVEHTSINPNKAAHIGHLRNAILGDTFVRLLRAAGQKVVVQNYIDNTGVQVADIVVALKHLELDGIPGIDLPDQHSLPSIRKRVEYYERESRKYPENRELLIDYVSWRLYAQVNVWYMALETTEQNQEEAAKRKKIRLDTLREIEQGNNETAEIAELISTAVLRRHLETMQRLDIEYDFLPRESEILHLKFWESARRLMVEKGVLRKETAGKNKDCWVMTRPGTETVEGETDEDAKVIVRSNDTVTYVGKDIAYHLWKFRLLQDCEFGDELFYAYHGRNRHCYLSIDNRETDAAGKPIGTGIPVHFRASGADFALNVIDSRQSDAQANVKEALRGMGYAKQSQNLTHFSYEMVALTPRCAVDLGYTVSDEDLARPYIEVSGRKGFGVKADDLIDKLIAATRAEVDARQTGRNEAERQRIAEQIAIGALRYFMLKFTRNSVIAFDFKDALSFEGETGPYIQYAVVRARNIFRKAGTTPDAVLAEFAKLAELGSYLSGEENEDIWALWLRAGRRTLVLEQCITTSEPAYLAKHAFQLAQEFNNFYHKHHILNEEDPARKTFLLATAAVALRELIEVLSWLGIESPEAM